uniref:Aminoacyl-transfer RNA synthetases class-II family profile domain-containing protein n=1 Tax=Cuerna arida TaxID=1464854 RepID=A0A1B6EHH1_9HEMI
MACHFVQLLRKSFCPNQTVFGSQFFSSVKSVPKSSLLISGERASDTFIVVIPHLDFDERFRDLPLLEDNIKRRRLDLCVSEMKESWYFYKDWNEKRLQLQENLSKIGARISEVIKYEDSEDKKLEMENLQRHKDLLREDLQNVKKNVWSMEDTVIGDLLKLPNILHSLTPDNEEQLFIFDGENIEEKNNHLEVGVKLNILEFRNNLTYFLKNRATLFELAVSELIVDHFVMKDFLRFSNPDFARSVLAEGVGIAPNDYTHLFLLANTEGNNDHLYLCGGASLFPFCGFHAKHSVPKQSLPLKYISSGRQYIPDSGSLPGLYSVNQSTSVQLFLATHGEDDIYRNFMCCVEHLQDVFSILGLNFRIVNQPPYLLKSWESSRVSVQVFSPFHNVYVEVGSVSLIGDFISKRLRMCYSDKKVEPFLSVVSGSINIQTLLALCLERSHNDLFVPSALSTYMMK